MEILPKIVSLKGLTLSGTVKLANKHPQLALSYSIKPRGKYEHLIDVFPNEGVLRCGQDQLLRVRFTCNDLQKQPIIDTVLQIQSTLHNEYNRRLLYINSMSGWQAITSQPASIFDVPIQIGLDRDEICKQIHEAVTLENAFGNDDLSSIHNSNQELQLNQNQQNTLQAPLKTMASNLNLLEDSSLIIKDAQSVSLGFSVSKISPLQFGQSKNDSRLIPIFEQHDFLLTKNPNPNNSFIKMQSVQSLSMFSTRTGLVNSNQASSKTAEIIILAIIAASFVALGNNLGIAF